MIEQVLTIGLGIAFGALLIALGTWSFMTVAEYIDYRRTYHYFNGLQSQPKGFFSWCLE